MRIYLSEGVSGAKAGMVSTRTRVINGKGSLTRYNDIDRSYMDRGLETDLDKEIAVMLDKCLVMMDTYSKYPWLSGSLNQIAKTISGTGFSIVPTDISTPASDEIKGVEKRLSSFFRNVYLKRRWDNVKDNITYTAKMQLTVLYILLFGQAAWEVVRDGRGAVVGFDFVHGMVVPQYDKKGYYTNPAYKVYPFNQNQKGKLEYVEYESPQDLVMFSTPYLTGDLVGRTYLESLLEYTIPSDIYAARSYLSLHKNARNPAGIWILKDMDDDEWDSVTQMIDTYYKGPDNYGSSAIVTGNEVDFKEFRSSAKDDAPYLEGRNFVKGEVAAVTGVPTAKLGVSEDMDRSDLQVMKREFYETTVRPLTKLIEETIDEQVISRYFNSNEVKFEFRQPDFMTALERSTVARRFYESNAVSPDELRALYLNLPPRAEGGKLFRDEMLFTQQIAKQDNENVENKHEFGDGIDKEQGGPPSDRVPGSEEQEREPGEVGHSTVQEPNRPEQRKKVTIQLRDFQLMLSELKIWEKFVQDIVLGNRTKRDFEFKYIPSVVVDVIVKDLNKLVYGNSSTPDKLRWLSIISATTKEIISTFYDVVEILEANKV